MKLDELIRVLPADDTSVISVYWVGCKPTSAHSIFNDDMGSSDFPAFMWAFGGLEVWKLYVTGGDFGAPYVLNIELGTNSSDGA